MSNLVYRCSANPRHVITSPKPLERCLAIVNGCPCRGELVRVDRQRRKESV